MHREQTDSCQGVELEELDTKEKERKNLMDVDNSVVIAGSRGGGWGKKWKRVYGG